MTQPSLLPFQRRAVQFLAARRRAFLFDEMRVGKTAPAVTSCDFIAARSILVLCPAIARANWLREFRRFGGREGQAVLTRESPIDPALSVCSYDLLADPGMYRRIARNWDVVVLDEGHFLKEATASRTQAAHGILAGARYVWVLTGTPEPNNSHGELWGLLHAFGITKLDYWAFANRYCYLRRSPFGDKIVGSRPEMEAEFRAMIAPHMLRRTLREVAPEMPAIRWTAVAVEPGEIDDFAGLSDIVAAAASEEVDLRHRLDEAVGELAILDPDAYPNFRRLMALRKVRPVADLVRYELQHGLAKIIIFGWHDDVLQALRLALHDFGAVVVSGRTSHKKREIYQERFKIDPACRVIVCNIVAAGTAIDLSNADDALFIEEDWTPANNAQAAMRPVSQFKVNPVRIRTAVLSDSTDEQLQKVLSGKLNSDPFFCGSVAHHATIVVE